MDKKTEALKLALEVLEEAVYYVNDEASSPSMERDCVQAITAIREALADKCVCGEPDTPGTHRTDGPCLAERPPCKYPHCSYPCPDLPECRDAEQLAQQQEPDYHICPTCGGMASDPIVPPAQRKPLTDERIFELASEHQDWDRNLIRVRSFARAIEAAHGIKGDA